MSCAFGPLIRTTPIPPRRGGVAIATTVSSGENMSRKSGEDRGTLAGRRARAEARLAGVMPARGDGAPGGTSRVHLLLRRNDDRLHERVADAFRRAAGDLGDGHVHA